MQQPEGSHGRLGRQRREPDVIHQFGGYVKIELTELEVEFLKMAMREAIAQAQQAPYELASEVMPIFTGILEKLNA